MEMLNVRQLTP